MTRISVVDLTGLRRAQGLLNQLRNVGFVLTGLMVWPSVALPGFAPVLVVFFVANVWVARRSRLAVVILVLVAGGVGIYLERDYRVSLARAEARAEKGEGLLARRETAELGRGLIGFSRTAAQSAAGLAGVYLGALGLIQWVRRRLPEPEQELDRRRRLVFWAARVKARMTPRTLLFLGLANACFLVTILCAFAPLRIIESEGSPLMLLPPILVAFVAVVGGLRLLARAKRYAAYSLQEAQRLDPRRPVLLLRSFGDDVTPLERTRDQSSWQRSLLAPTFWTLEETIEKLLLTQGPVIAIGRPGEPVPPAGAAREYVPNDRWRARVRELIDEAAIVVVVLGETEGLRTEYRTLLEMGALPKLIALFPPRDAEALERLWRKFAEVAVPSGLETDVSKALAARFRGPENLEIVTCRSRDDEDDYGLALQRCL